MRFFLALIASASLLIAGCEYDNFEQPESTLSGRVVYNGNPVGVRNNGAQLQVWQDGFQLRTPISVYINSDGSYSAKLFDGTYKMVRMGNSPWLQESTDTIVVEVKGNTQKDIPVTPYFTVANESFQFANNTFTANFVINKVAATANVDAVALFIGKSILTDQNRNEHRVALTTSSLVLGANSTISTQLPTTLSGLSYVYARIGVKATATGEYSYTQVQKINLK